MAQQIVDGGEQLLSQWVDAALQRSWALRTRSHKEDHEGPSTWEALRQRCRHFLEALSSALSSSSESLEVGSATYREAVQSLSFTAGWMAGVGLPITDAIALVHGLEEALRWPQQRFFQSLTVVITEAYSASLVQREHGRYRDAMEKSQLVCEPHPRLPCLFLVGDPDRRALDDAVGRVMMLAVMREAPVVLVDGSALLHPETVFSQAFKILREHSKATSVQVMLSGVPPIVARELRGDDTSLELFEALPDAWSKAVKTAQVTWL